MTGFKDIPAHYKLCFSQAQIAQSCVRLGEQIAVWCNEVQQKTSQDVLAVPVLRGGLFFFADLVRQINTSIEFSPAQTWGYQVGENQVMSSEVRVESEGLDANGRSILLVDDLCDSGRSLKALKQRVLEQGAKEVKTAVLIRRLVTSPHCIPEWAGIDYPGEEWFVGYGMDDADRRRNLPDIYIMNVAH